jgi:hypothetical protein
MCAIRSAVRQRYIFAITELKGSLIVSSFLQVKMGGEEEEEEGGVCFCASVSKGSFSFTHS